MKIFLDSANIDAIKKYNELGLVDGVTTNPTLLSKEKEHPAEIMKQIVKIIKGPVSLEVIGTTAQVMIEEAHRLMKFGQNVVVKIPMIPDGMKAVKQLKQDGISTNVTLVFSANQAVLAAKGRSILHKSIYWSIRRRRSRRYDAYQRDSPNFRQLSVQN